MFVNRECQDTFKSNKKLPKSNLTRCTEAKLGHNIPRRHMQLVYTIQKLKSHVKKTHR